MGDYDNDGDLDLLITGLTGTSPSYQYTTRLYRNDLSGSPNAAPSAPSGLRAVIAMTGDGPLVTFRWSAASDDHTPAANLTYNLRIGTTPGGNQISASMAAGGGYRKIPAKGTLITC